ncbi:MAG: hypothetical protein ABEK01_01070 [Candidatus Nanohaloarchaea archaeon]
MKFHPERDIFAAIQEENVSVFRESGEKILTRKIDSVAKPRFTDYDGDREYELAVATDRAVKVYDLDLGGPETVNQSLDRTVFVGSGREMLKAVALNGTSFVADRYGEVREEAVRAGEPVGVGDVTGLERVDLDGSFPREKRFYVESRRKAVLLAPLAAERNASLVFEPRGDYRDFTDRSLSEIREMFIEEFRPNHVVAADLSSDSGVLASYMAARQGALPVQYSEDPEVLKDRIQTVFGIIGDNRNTVLQGRYVTILEGPPFRLDDPVEEGLLGSDPGDGSRFSSYLRYGNLWADRELEAGVGVYPDETALASELYHSSLVRDPEKQGLVAAEYLHSNWPVILGAAGGGMWHGKKIEDVLQREGFSTTRLVEYRVRPVEFLLGLTPVSVKSFLSKTDSLKNRLKSFISDSAANSVQNAVIVLKGASYAEQSLELYLELQWEGFDFSPEKGFDRLEEMDIAEGESMREAVQNGAVKLLYAFVFPEKHPRITPENLNSSLKKSDVVYYGGRGNSTAWVLPNNDTSLVKDRYTGSFSFRPSQVPELDQPIVWDSSDLAGSYGGEMRRSFIERGAASYIGYSSVNYAQYSYPVAARFFLHGKRVGESLRRAVNSLRQGFFVYDPNTPLKTGVRKKMESSAVLYGNPEMRKDPVPEKGMERSKECSGTTCTVTLSAEPEPEWVRSGGNRFPVLDTGDVLLRDLAPVVPIYVESGEIPLNASVDSVEISEDFRSAEIDLPRNTLLSHGGRYFNRSLGYQRFPRETSRFNLSKDGFVYVQAAVQKTGSGHRILESSSLTLNYSAPVTLDLSGDSGEMELVISSERSFRGRLVLVVDGNSTVRKLKVSEGKNVLHPSVSPGKHRIEAYLISGRKKIAQDSGSFDLRSSRVILFAPDLKKGVSGDVVAVVKNPTDFAVRKELVLDTGEGLVPGLTEDLRRTVVLESGGERRIRWTVIGVSKGRTSVSVNGKDVSVRVRGPGSVSRSSGGREFRWSISGPRQSLMYQVSPGGTEAIWNGQEARLEVHSSSSSRRMVLENDGYRVKIVERPGRIVRSFRSSSGHFREVISGGTKVSYSGVTRERFERKLDELRSAVKRLQVRLDRTELR